MREIKFRVWDMDYKRMVYPDGIEWKPEVIYYYKNNIGMPCHKKLCNIMQYTGLKDKNGKEIYEGDICVRYLDGKKVCTDGKTWKDYWLIEWLNKTAGFTTTKIADYSVHFKKMMTVDKKQNSFSTRFNEVEVIGNIYENPELLEEPK